MADDPETDTGGTTAAVEEANPEEEAATDTEAVAEEEAAADTEAVAEDEAEPAAEEAEPAGAAGTRDDPLPLGSTLEGEEWDVTVNSVAMNADEEVLAANQFNDPAPEGQSYMLANVTVTYKGEDSDMIMFGTSFAFVTASGETISASDTFAVGPDELDLSQELYNGGTATGNVVFLVPDSADGTIRVETGFLDTQEAFFALE